MRGWQASPLHQREGEPESSEELFPGACPKLCVCWARGLCARFLLGRPNQPHCRKERFCQAMLLFLCHSRRFAASGCHDGERGLETEFWTSPHGCAHEKEDPPARFSFQSARREDSPSPRRIPVPRRLDCPDGAPEESQDGIGHGRGASSHPQPPAARGPVAAVRRREQRGGANRLYRG